MADNTDSDVEKLELKMSMSFSGEMTKSI